MAAFFERALAEITRSFGSFYLWVVLAPVVLCGVLAFGRYGDLELGADDEEPEFSTFAWFAMLFAAGMGIGLVFWGVAEPLSHYGTAPPGVALLSLVATLLVLVFFVTSGDSATLVLGMMSTGGTPNPSAKVKILWGLLAGGVKAVQTATIVFALPFTVVILPMALALWRAVKHDWQVGKDEERQLRRRMREIAQK